MRIMSLIFTLVFPLAVLFRQVITHSLSLNWNQATNNLRYTVDLEADNAQEFDVVVPGSGNDVVLAAIDVSHVVSLYIVADADMTLTINDDGTPDATITLLEDVPVLFYTGCNFSNPLGAVDVTSFKVAKASAGDGNFYMRVLQDATA